MFFHGILMGFNGILWDFMGFYGILMGVQWDFHMDYIHLMVFFWDFNGINIECFMGL